MRSKLGRSGRVQEDAHVGGALRSERLLELLLRVRPSLHSVPEMGFAGAVTRSSLLRRSWLPCDQAVALQQQDLRRLGDLGPRY